MLCYRCTVSQLDRYLESSGRCQLFYFRNNNQSIIVSRTALIHGHYSGKDLKLASLHLQTQYLRCKSSFVSCDGTSIKNIYPCSADESYFPSAPNFCQLPEAKNAVPTADCVSAEQSQVGKLVCSSISHLSLLVTNNIDS